MSSLRAQGWRGLYDGYLPWPFGEAEHAILRESAFPEAMARKSKRFLLQPRSTLPTCTRLLSLACVFTPTVLPLRCRGWWWGEIGHDPAFMAATCRHPRVLRMVESLLGDHAGSLTHSQG